MYYWNWVICNLIFKFLQIRTQAVIGKTGLGATPDINLILDHKEKKKKNINKITKMRFKKAS